MEIQSLPKHSYFSDYLKLPQVVFDLKSKDKVEAIEELLDVLAKQKLIENKKLLLTRIIDRENLVSTAIGFGVALPHARVDTGGEIAVAVGRSEKGIDFEAHDGQKVHLIILVVWNPTLPGLFNHLFAGPGPVPHPVRLPGPDPGRQGQGRAPRRPLRDRVQVRLRGEISSRASLLKKLQELEIKRKKATREQQKVLQKQAGMIREELDRDLLGRFDRLMDRYGFAVADVVEGVCQGCNINISTQMYSAIEGSNDVYVCENCGKFLASARKKKK
jgi:mannitol/fructose-specific phosphotransferase system IIA component (Ntr-type)